MGNIREKLVFTAFFALFIGGAIFLVWRESAQVNLKSGMRLLDANDPGAIPILESGLRKNRNDNLLHYTLARTLHKLAFAKMTREEDGKPRLFEARRSVNNALALRFDGYGQQMLAFNYELSGEDEKALTYYNISFFFSQEVKELKQWERLRPQQSETAKEYFKADMTGVSLIMVYNALTGYSPHSTPSPATVFLNSFFLSVSPVDWLNKDWAEAKGILKNRFDELGTADKEVVVRRFKEAGFGFLSRFLLSPVS